MADVAKRGWNGPSIYVLCKSSGDSTERILLQYDFANHIWSTRAVACNITINISHTENITWATLGIGPYERGWKKQWWLPYARPYGGKETTCYLIQGHSTRHLLAIC